MIGDTQEQILSVLKSIEKKLNGSGGGAGGVGVQQGGTGVQQGGTAVNTNVAVPGEQEPLTDTSVVYTTGEDGAQIFNEDFVSEGEFVLGFTSRVLYVRTNEDVVMEFDREGTPVERVPIPASLGEITLGDGGAGFRADKVRFKLADTASAEEATVHIIAYR
ncbi:MAG: hypothetical protein U5J64_11135 [Halobacteriales archaeon]|nr:hypothetical protein [Halobacteriales archaeon]